MYTTALTKVLMPSIDVKCILLKSFASYSQWCTSCKFGSYYMASIWDIRLCMFMCNDWYWCIKWAFHRPAVRWCVSRTERVKSQIQHKTIEAGAWKTKLVKLMGYAQSDVESAWVLSRKMNNHENLWKEQQHEINLKQYCPGWLTIFIIHITLLV